MANSYIGEIGFSLDDKEYVMRPSFGAIAEIESKIEMSIFNLIELIHKRGMLLNEQKIIFFYSLKYGSGEIGMKTAEDILLKLGPIKSLEYCLRIIEQFFPEVK